MRTGILIGLAAAFAWGGAAVAALYTYEGTALVKSPGEREEPMDPAVCACDALGTAVLWGEVSTMETKHYAICAEYGDAGNRVWMAYLPVDGTYPIPNAPGFSAYGLLLYPAKPIAAFEFSIYFNPLYSYLYYGPNQHLMLPGGGQFRYLASTPPLDYYYCYRYYNGSLQICKMRVLDVISAFTPPAEVLDITCDAAGNVYIWARNYIYKYTGSGVLITSWSIPYLDGGINFDLSYDAQGRILALASVEEEGADVYVFTDTGSFLESFWVASRCWETGGADVAPNGKYYIQWPVWYSETAYIDRFAPVTPTVVPTSVGQIKALFR
jgi:hypothetical protein